MPKGSTTRALVQAEPVSQMNSRQYVNHTCYVGSADALIAAGVVELRHLPGLGCKGRSVAATFIGDALQPKSGSTIDAKGRRLRVYRSGRKFTVHVDIDREADAMAEWAALMERMKQPLSMRSA